MSIKMRRTTCGLALGLLVLSLALLVAACGGEEQTTTTTAGPTTTVAPVTTTTALSETEIIAANWVAFFAAATPVSDKVTLLENGDAHQAELAAVGRESSGRGRLRAGHRRQGQR